MKRVPIPNGYFRIAIIVLVFMIAASSTPFAQIGKAWEETRSKGTLSAYKQFLQTYPQAKDEYFTTFVGSVDSTRSVLPDSTGKPSYCLLWMSGHPIAFKISCNQISNLTAETTIRGLRPKGEFLIVEMEISKDDKIKSNPGTKRKFPRESARSASTDSLAKFDDPPKLLFFERPEYPESDQKMGLEGTVRIKVSLDEKGRVVDAELLQSTGSQAMDRAALVAARRCRFLPAKKDGIPVRSEVMIPFEFRLNH